MASPATSSRSSSAVASKAPYNDPYRAQKPVAEIDVVLVFDASPGPERRVHQVWDYFRHIMEHLTARGQHVSRVRIRLWRASMQPRSAGHQKPVALICILPAIEDSSRRDYLWPCRIIRGNAQNIPHHQANTIFYSRRRHVCSERPAR